MTYQPFNILLIGNAKYLNDLYSSLRFNPYYTIYKTAVAFDGMRFLYEKQIDIIILADNLDGINASDTLFSIKKINPSIKIILMKSDESKPSFAFPIATKADLYIDKPCEFGQIEEAIESLSLSNYQ